MKSKSQTGFTLIEMALALLIMGLVVGGGLNLMSSQMESQKLKETQSILEEAKTVLIGFAVAKRRLPCPASATSLGQESFCTNAAPAACGAALVSPAAMPAHGRCSNPYNGFLPAAALGLSPTDEQGYATDAWGIAPNRIRYAVTEANASAFTQVDGMKTVTMAVLTPNLYVCTSATGITATTCGTATALTSTAPAVIYSLGKNAPLGGTGTDETANSNPNSANNDPVFVSHTPMPLGAANGEFDDIVIWLSPNILYNRMVQAGQLP